jgi:DNA-binding GntR family transcriptional regulator
LNLAGKRHNRFPWPTAAGFVWHDRTMFDNDNPQRIKRNEQSADGAARQLPIYERVSQLLRRALDDGSIPPGLVLLEGPVADILSVTRTPVRKALHALEEEGLVSRFDGRGYTAGAAGVEPRRIALEAAMLGLDSDAEPVRKTRGWESIYDEVERNIVHLSVFDSYRVNELELARHFNVGRMVARDVLLRLEALGLLEKDERMRWAIKPLDADRLNHLYELRWLLEPTALRGGARSIPPAELQTMVGHLRQAMTSYPKISRIELDELEHDLHIGLLSRCPNVDLLQSLERTRCILTLSKHVLGETAPMPKSDPFMSEHLEILEAVGRDDIALAEGLLRKHLESSCVKLIQRVALLRKTYGTPKLPYITGVAGPA